MRQWEPRARAFTPGSVAALKLPCLGYDGESVERGPMGKAGQKYPFKAQQFTAEIILWAVR
jgi:hypothetical protein